jgi:UDP-N-acetylglucosamine diphosphorylase/glucosamine-1-phosphate N-acetyltransferase
MVRVNNRFLLTHLNILPLFRVNFIHLLNFANYLVIPMNLILADDQFRDQLLPFAFTRPVADIRVGILTIRHKWEMLLKIPQGTSGSLTSFYLSGRFPLSEGKDCLLINGSLLPDANTLKAIQALKPNQQLVWEGRLIAAMLDRDKLVGKDHVLPFDELESIPYVGTPDLLNNVWEIFTKNDAALRADFQLLTKGRRSEVISGSNQTIQPDQIFIEAGAKVECAILNASTGPIYIGKDAEVMEGCMVRGPFALGEHAVLKMGAKVYGATTIGPGSKVGGEVSNSVIFANSNKAHDGFLGNSVLGEWCNLGADTNNSNLKNNYSEVKIWNYPAADYKGTGLQFCGLFMGDHSKCGINTMFNTGTVVGVFANVFGAGFPEKFIPSFSWGGTGESEVFLLDKALALAEKVMARRNIVMTEADRNILSHLFMIQLKPASDI